MAFQNTEVRDRWLPRFLSIHNELKKPSALGWIFP